MRPNKKVPVFRVTRPYLNFPNLDFFQLLWKKCNFMHFERQDAFQNALNYIFSRNFFFFLKKICVLTQPKIFRPVTPKHTYFFIWPNSS